MTARSGSMPFLKTSSLLPTNAVSISRLSSRHLRWRSFLAHTEESQLIKAVPNPRLHPNTSTTRGLARVRSEPFSEIWFTASFPVKKIKQEKEHGILQTTLEGVPGDGKDFKPPDERTVKLGKTLRILSPLLPNILTTPLPQEILSPSITLHLFPSTHPHLPVVKGRVPYRAALWTAPVAWGTVPIVGNVKLEIASEKIVRTGYISAPTYQDEEQDGLGEEKLVVRWRTEKKHDSSDNSSTNSTGSSNTSMSSAAENGGINRGLSTLMGGSQPIFGSSSTEPFTGLFIFSFDKEGRIASQTIEHADEGHGCDKTSKVVTLTDWLLGKARWGRAEELMPGFAMRGVECLSHTQRRGWSFRRGRED